MGNQNTTINNQKDMPQDHQVKEAVPKIGRSLTDGGSDIPGYFTNPAAHLRQPNYMSDDDDEILPPRDPYDIPQLRQPAQTGEEDDDDWVIVDHPQGETKQDSLPSKPRPMARSFTVPVKCGTCGDDFQEHINSKSFECLSCSIDKVRDSPLSEDSDLWRGVVSYEQLVQLDKVRDSPLSEDSDLWRGVVSYEQLVQLDKVRDFDEELLDKSSNALKIERQLTMAHVPDPPVKSWAAVLNTGPKKFRNPIQEAKDAAKAAKAEESIRRREEEEKADAAYRKQMEHRRFHTESYNRMRKKSEERTNKRRNAVRQMNEMEDHEDFWGVGHENRLDLGDRYGDDREYRRKWENLEEQMRDSDSNCSLSCYDWTE
jgi:hypothetical protein